MARIKTSEITRENFFDYTPRQLFEEIERLTDSSEVERLRIEIKELKASLLAANATIRKVTNALGPTRPYQKRAKE